MRLTGQFQFCPRVLCQIWFVSLALALYLPLSAGGAVGSGVYQTAPGAMVLEKGDRIINGSRFVPLVAMVTLNFNSAQATLTGVISNAVLEGGAPFELAVTNFLAYPVTNGNYKFHGYYMPGSQYVFDWTFSTTTNGGVVWNGNTYCGCGHIWYIAITNLAMTSVPWLNIARVGPASARMTWSTNLANCVLESSSGLPGVGWNAVTNDYVTEGDQFSVTVDATVSSRFFRLRKL